MKGLIDYDNLVLTIGKNFSQLRNLKNEDIKTVASAIGISPEDLKSIEEARYPFKNIALLLSASKYFNVLFQQLLELDIVQVFNYSQNIHPGDRQVTQKNEYKDGYEFYINDLKREIKQQDKIIAERNAALAKVKALEKQLSDLKKISANLSRKK